MSFNKRGGSNITLIIQDEGWNKLATYKWNSADIKKQNYILKTIEDAFGAKIRIRSNTDWMK